MAGLSDCHQERRSRRVEPAAALDPGTGWRGTGARIRAAEGRIAEGAAGSAPGRGPWRRVRLPALPPRRVTDVHSVTAQPDGGGRLSARQVRAILVWHGRCAPPAAVIIRFAGAGVLRGRPGETILGMFWDPAPFRMACPGAPVWSLWMISPYVRKLRLAAELRARPPVAGRPRPWWFSPLGSEDPGTGPCPAGTRIQCGG